MAGRQLAQMGTPVLQVAVYRWYLFYCWILVETSMLLVQGFTLFQGKYKMWPPSNIILILMELTTPTKGGSYCKGSASWVPLLVVSQGDRNQNEPRDQFTSSHPDDISGFTKREWCLHLISPCVTSVRAEPFQVSSPLCLKVDLQENPLIRQNPRDTQTIQSQESIYNIEKIYHLTQRIRAGEKASG